ncbi:probable multidrug resistance-associated protein lethal(2)03659 [Harmonia axyridis]|uniref:probable multidrug resistance-associated protein lethal(2)03659 n=1 Tax=Harmonia axyridis TaxID=115357 RepID=UPI001E278D0D|nr:probable multidrug resistance-associated protein lethal(2)03659 [Harmonia axyridis]XP_045472549.1 probable multidrug resistance-associated protein lethal(2)03659 [Harmonia axyridis]
MEVQNEKVENKSQHPLASAGFFSKLFFLYTFNSLKKTFDPKKPYLPLLNDRSELLGDRLERSWNKQSKTTGKKKKKYALFKSILDAFRCEILTIVVIATIEVVLRIAEPVCLGFILSYFQPHSTMSKQEVLLWTIGMLAANGLRVIAYSQQRYQTLHTSMKIRVSCSNLIYRKVLRLRSTTLQKDGGGKIVTLISNDLSRFDMRTELINYVYTTPIVVVAVTIIVYQQFGVSGLVGVGFIFLVSLIQAFFAHYTSLFQLLASNLTDERLSLMHSLLSGIQVMKMYAWEKPFAQLIEKVRTKELDVIGKSFLVKAVYESVYTFIVPISIFLALYVVIEEHRKITVVMVFLLLIYYTLLNYIISIFFTLGIAKLFELWIVLSRVNNFLLMKEREVENSAGSEDPDEVFVQLDNVSAAWDEVKVKEDEDTTTSSEDLSEKTSLLPSKNKSGNTERKSAYYREAVCLKSTNSLRGISLRVESNQFIGIIGEVGSGKSSLLQVILGELLVSSGNKKIGGKISYAPQTAWTFASTIRQNILFGLDYDNERYKEVLRVCGLEQDLKLFLNGDLTVIGDRGASLSGGQKARINLARAIYRDADIYLLDDPLSAVDVRVANHLFNECIMSFLKTKCKILVTHHVSQLRQADNIIAMKKGVIEKQGSYEDMIRVGAILDDSEPLEETNIEMDSFKDNFSFFKDREENLNTSMSTSTSFSSSILDSTETEAGTTRFDQSYTEKSQKILHNSRKKGLLFFKYILAGGNVFLLLCTTLLFVLNQVLISGISYYLGVWTSIEEIRDRLSYLGPALLRLLFGLHLKMFYEDWFGYLVIALCIAAILKACLYAKLVKSNSKKLHDTMLEKVTGTSLRFFDITSSGRILNRFSRDIGIIDEPLPRSIMEATQILLMSIGSFVLLVLVDFDFIIPTAILNIIFVGLLIIFSRLTKKIKRVESRMVGPILSHVNNSAQGITTIKALSAESVLIKEFENHQDNYTSSWFLYGTSSIALSFYIDLSCFLFLLYIAFVLVFYADSLHISGGFVGVALTQAMSLTGVIQYGLRQTLEANNQLIAVERVSRYNNLDKEEEPFLYVELPPDWPAEGKIVFEKVGLRYDPLLPLSLRNLSFLIQPMEKVGIVGRTGAGKSSIMAALFRLTLVEGRIEIDGFDTRDISLKLLRSKISVIPQDPILFAGTLRFNLDPFEEHNDSTLHKAIQDVDLKDASGQYYSLNYQVMERGSNCSVGQRQLICLARALIRNNKILLMDEATANVDPGTDTLIQKTIRKQFSLCTVITVAHRLNTVMDSDRVIVMDSGQIIEFDHPHLLLQNPTGTFYRMIHETGNSESERLKKAAFDSYIGWKK